MDILYLLISSIIILVCVYLVVSPLFLQKKYVAYTIQEEKENLTLEAIYSAVNELEMDYLMKKIKKVDYLQLKEQYQLLAAKVMKTEGPLSKKNKKDSSDIDKVELEILDELKKIRKQKGR